MRESVSTLTQSKYYSPAFNHAVFDGPIRVYFAQHQEPLALKVYFELKNRIESFWGSLEELSKRTNTNIFIMLYPSAENFHLAFEEDRDVVAHRLGDDYVIGVRGVLSDPIYEGVYHRVETILKVWAPIVRENPPLEAEGPVV